MEDKRLLPDNELAKRLPELGWQRDGLFIHCTYHFDSYQDVNRFLPYLAHTIANQNHHPDFSFDSGRRTVDIRVTTHSAGGITQADLLLAQTLNQWDHDDGAG